MVGVIFSKTKKKDTLKKASETISASFFTNFFFSPSPIFQIQTLIFLTLSNQCLHWRTSIENVDDTYILNMVGPNLDTKNLGA